MSAAVEVTAARLRPRMAGTATVNDACTQQAAHGARPRMIPAVQAAHNRGGAHSHSQDEHTTPRMPSNTSRPITRGCPAGGCALL
eukprot:14673543-Alexandrium_andersonii.AAC.1